MLDRETQINTDNNVKQGLHRERRVTQVNTGYTGNYGLLGETLVMLGNAD